MNFTFINGNVIEQFTLFNKFKVDGDTQILYVSVNEEFFFLLNQLTSNFTRFELKEFVTLKSSYAKEFYRRMKQFKYTGVWIVSIEEFKNKYSYLKKVIIYHEQGQHELIENSTIKVLAKNIFSTEYFFDTREISETLAVELIQNKCNSDSIEVIDLSLSELMTVKRVLE